MAVSRPRIEIKRKTFGSVHCRNSSNLPGSGCAIVLSRTGIIQITDITATFFPQTDAYTQVGRGVFRVWVVASGAPDLISIPDMSGYDPDPRAQEVDGGDTLFDALIVGTRRSVIPGTANQAIVTPQFDYHFSTPLFSPDGDRMSIIATFFTHASDPYECILSVNGCVIVNT